MQKKDIKTLAFLKDYIDGDGLVNYERLKDDQWLKDQVKRIETINLQNMNKQERFAFWLNAYNILVLKGVYIELGKNSSWKGNNSFWKRFKFFYLRRFNVAGKRINLYNIENKIIRKEFKDPRIHFAINCASQSCPTLPGRLFEATTLDSYLDDLTRSFVNDENHVNYNEERSILNLNRIFKWYSKDFSGEGGVIEFVLKYLSKLFDPNKIRKAKIAYFDYNWTLNSQQTSKLLFIPSVQ
jgi:hypothetical protein